VEECHIDERVDALFCHKFWRKIISNDSAESHIARPERNRHFFMEEPCDREKAKPWQLYHLCTGGSVPARPGPDAPQGTRIQRKVVKTRLRFLDPQRGHLSIAPRHHGTPFWTLAGSLIDRTFGAVAPSEPSYRLEKPFHNPNTDL